MTRGINQTYVSLSYAISGIVAWREQHGENSIKPAPYVHAAARLRAARITLYMATRIALARARAAALYDISRASHLRVAIYTRSVNATTRRHLSTSIIYRSSA